MAKKRTWAVQNEAIAVMILGWAKQVHPEKYDATIKVAHLPETFRRYMIRLIEIRCTEDRAYLKQIPVSVLDESALSLTLVHTPTGQSLNVGGALAAPKTMYRFWELALPKDEFLLISAAKRSLDLEYTDG